MSSAQSVKWTHFASLRGALHSGGEVVKLERYGFKEAGTGGGQKSCFVRFSMKDLKGRLEWSLSGARRTCRPLYSG